MVRLCLVLALAVYLSGIPVVAGAPCAQQTAGTSCCMRHQTETGGLVIGHCPCRVPSAGEEPGPAVSTAAASAERPAQDAVATASVAAVLDLAPPAVQFVGVASSLVDTSPPRLTGAGFRC